MSWHECPECGAVCYCDMEDHHNAAASDECDHWLDEDCAARRGECDDEYEPDSYDDLYGDGAVARMQAMESAPDATGRPHSGEDHETTTPRPGPEGSGPSASADPGEKP